MGRQRHGAPPPAAAAPPTRRRPAPFSRRPRPPPFGPHAPSDGTLRRRTVSSDAHGAFDARSLEPHEPRSSPASSPRPHTDDRPTKRAASLWIVEESSIRDVTLQRLCRCAPRPRGGSARPRAPPRAPRRRARAPPPTRPRDLPLPDPQAARRAARRPHAALLLRHVRHFDARVQQHALEGLAKLDAAAIAPHAATIVAHMERRVARARIGLRVLWRVPKPALAAFAAPLCRYAVGADAAVRRAALTAGSTASPRRRRRRTPTASSPRSARATRGSATARSPPSASVATAERLPLVPAIAARLSHPVAGVRGAALDALADVPPPAADANARVEMLAAELDDGDYAVRRPPSSRSPSSTAPRARRGRGVGASRAIVSATLPRAPLRDDAHWRVREAAHAALAVLEAPPSASAAATPVPPIVASQPTGSTDDLMCGDDAGDDDASQLSEATSTASSPAPQASGSQKQRRRPSPAVPASASARRRQAAARVVGAHRVAAAEGEQARRRRRAVLRRRPLAVDARLVARPLR